MDIYVDVFYGTSTKFKVQVFASGVGSGYEVDKLECLASVMEGLSRENNLYLDERGVGIVLANILDERGIKYKSLGLKSPVILKDETEDLKRILKLEKARSGYWRCVANGEVPIVVGSKEDREYIMR